MFKLFKFRLVNRSPLLMRWGGFFGRLFYPFQFNPFYMYSICIFWAQGLREQGARNFKFAGFHSVLRSQRWSPKPLKMLGC